MTFELILTREVSKGSFILDGFEPDKPGNLYLLAIRVRLG
jgi:hypothetical protein